jgi:hypothetical protein
MTVINHISRKLREHQPVYMPKNLFSNFKESKTKRDLERSPKKRVLLMEK